MEEAQEKPLKGGDMWQRPGYGRGEGQVTGRGTAARQRECSASARRQGGVWLHDQRSLFGWKERAG